MELLWLIGFFVIFGALTVLTEIEYFGWTTICLIACGFAAKFLHVFDVFVYVKEHIVTSLTYAGIYVAVGVVWSFAKWFFFLINERDATRNFVKKELAKYKKDNSGYWSEPKINIPQASDNKGRIVAWMSFWPLSVVGTLLNDPIRKLFNYCFNQFKHLYQAMSNKLYAADMVTLNLVKEAIELERKAKREKLIAEQVIINEVKKL